MKIEKYGYRNHHNHLMFRGGDVDGYIKEWDKFLSSLSQVSHSPFGGMLRWRLSININGRIRGAGIWGTIHRDLETRDR